VESRDGRQWRAPNLVVAAGHQLPALLPFAELPLYPVRGQVSHVPTTAGLSKLKTVLCYDGYLTPAHNGAHCIGASYGRNQTDLAYRTDEQEQNRARLQACVPQQRWPAEVDVSGAQARIGCAAPAGITCRSPGPSPGWRRWRIMTSAPRISRAHCPARRPLRAGGARLRGLCSAPLCGELVASEICGDPLPLAADLLEALHPARYWVRRLRRGKPLRD
jgi:tRNA 5-methylaminomethyl-2-thiouridine biosynthesis bifunctional protein